ncbi:MAG: UDP-N-acetylglucosamine 4,6-dehydratase (inverting) [Phycisphaerae bacterium]|nr:UDP-N-acetylglucosamine 4,6-dehydratase (inverting) [Phycisphaerae bacterium]
MLNGKSILITGGTGSFGKKFAETILRDYPEIQRIVIYSRDEFKQFQMSNMPQFVGNEKLRYFIGDVRDEQRLCRAFDGVDIVVHAAALKQVPACEYNPFEAVKTNVIGAENVINTAIDKSVKKVVALSTDKACSPINLYGATKLCSDKLFIAGNAYVGSKETRFCVVRYGNVAGSRGSVIPYFKKLIAGKAKSLPITDVRMTRFWLVLEEAVEMVLHALEVMHGGELFVRKIPSMKLTDLAKTMAPDLPIKEVGIRPGEKIHEVMISREDSMNTRDFGNYYIIGPSITWWKTAQYRLEGQPVPEGFEYHSGNNSDWLTIDQMTELISKL